MEEEWTKWDGRREEIDQYEQKLIEREKQLDQLEYDMREQRE